MSVWLELHCDAKRNNPDPTGVACMTHTNDHPGCLTDNSAADVSCAMKIMKSDARKKGWKFTRKDGWTCPACRKIEVDADLVPYTVTILFPPDSTRGASLVSNCFARIIFARSKEEAIAKAEENITDNNYRVSSAYPA